MYRWLLVTTALVVLLCWSALARAAGVQARFSLETPSAGPFPSNLFTVSDPQQITGLRVQLPLPNCTERPSDCTTLAEINTLDGFHVQPRLSMVLSQVFIWDVFGV